MLLEQVPLDDLGLDFLNPARGAGGFDKGFEFPLPDVIIDPLAGSIAWTVTLMMIKTKGTMMRTKTRKVITAAVRVSCPGNFFRIRA